MTRSIATKPSGRRQESARARAEHRAARRRFWRTARRGAIVVGLAVAAVALVFAYRTTGGGGGSSHETLLSNQAPDFTLPTVDGRQVKLSDFRGEKNVLLFFNEGYGCAPCWQQAVALQETLDQFGAADTEVFTVMVDPPELLAREASRWGLTLPMLVDRTTEVSASYHALGGMHANKPNHTFIFVDKEGVVRWDQDYPSMWVENDVVVEQVRSLAQP